MINKFLLGLFLVFVPLQVKTLVFTREVYASGFFNPYLSHFLYLSDIFLLLALIFCGFSLVFHKNSNFKFCFDKNLLILCCIFLLSMFFSIVFAVDQLNSWMYFLRFCEFFVLALFIACGRFSLKYLIFIFIGVNTFVALIGILQFIFQHSIGLNFLGEPELLSGARGLASVEIFGRKFIRAYGTFSHPNIFSAYLAFSLIFIAYYSVKLRRNHFLIGVFVVCFIALFLTFSRAAFLALFLVFLFTIFWKKFKKFKFKSWFVCCLILVFGLVFFLNNAASLVNERLMLMNVSWKMFFDNPFGVGVGNFTDVMQNFAGNKLLPWNFQPVHNIYLLILNEIGWFGLLVFLILIIYLLHRFIKSREYLLLGLLIFIIFAGLFDHYLFSLYHGQFLVWFFIGLACRYPHTFAEKNLNNVE